MYFQQLLHAGFAHHTKRNPIHYLYLHTSLFFDAAKVRLIFCKRVAKTPNHPHIPRLTASHKRFIYKTDMTKQKVMPPEKMETPVSGYHLCH
jgi:hypothetical protein